MEATEKYVAWFVNRERQHRGFLKMLAGETRKRIMLVTADKGMGKTWLIQRMAHDCSMQQVPFAKFNFSDEIGRDILELVRKARDEFGAPHYQKLTHVINEVTGARIRVNIESVDVSIQNSQLTNTDVTVDDRTAQMADRFEFVQVDDERMRTMIDARINDVFFDCLLAQTAAKRAVFLFDGYERAQPEAQRWVERELLQRIHDGRLDNTIVILTSRSQPGFSDRLSESIASTDLSGFNEDHIREYIERRNASTILDKHDNFIQMVLDINAHNSPGMLARMVDGYMLNASSQDDDEWLL